MAAIPWPIALGTEQFDGFANVLRAADLAGVHQAVQTDFTGAVIDAAKFFRRDTKLIAAHAESDNRF